MIELQILNHLKSALDCPVDMERRGQEGAFVVVQKTGSARENYIDMASIAVQSHAPTLYEAAELNNAAKVAMYELTRLENVSAVRLNSDYNFTDTTRKGYRYQALFNIYYKE